MRRSLLALVVLALTACATVPTPFTEDFYAPLRIRRADVPGTPVAVYAFTDLRGLDDPRLVLLYEPLDGPARVERATAPVGVGVARAFARGLGARGFAVTDATATRYTPGTAAPTPLVVTGHIADFGVRIARVGILGGWQSRTTCRITVDVWDAAGARKLSEKSYQREVTGAIAPTEPMTVLSQVLAEVVAQAVTEIALK